MKTIKTTQKIHNKIMQNHVMCYTDLDPLAALRV